MKTGIVYQADETYAGVLSIALYSLLRSNSEAAFSIAIIDDGLSASSKRTLNGMTQEFGKQIKYISAKTINQIVDNTGLTKYKGFRKNAHSYLKLIYPSICDDYDRILYLDCDTLVIGNIEGLLNLDLKNSIVAMSLDSSVDLKYKKVIGLEAYEPYFNSGVIVIDVEKWKEANVLDKIQTVANNGRQYSTVDQDYINIALRGNCEVISNKYNFQPFHRRYTPEEYLNVYQKQTLYYNVNELKDAEKDVRILHFFRYLGMHPWDYRSLHPFKEEFIYYWNQVPGVQLPSITPNTLSPMIRLERGLYRVLPKILFLRVFRVAHNRMLEK